MLLESCDLSEQITQLIQKCIEGDRNSQRQLYELYVHKMFVVCLRYSKTREDAEEILQEGFVQVFRSLINFKSRGSFAGWVRKIMFNTAVAHYRGTSKMYTLANIDITDLGNAGGDEIIDFLGKKELLKMIHNLPSSYRRVFNLFVYEGFKHREIAWKLGISVGTSKSNLFDAKRILQRVVANNKKIASPALPA